MSPSRRKLVTFLAVAGFVFCIGGAVFNVGLLLQDENPNQSRPIVAPLPLAVFGIGAGCFVAGIILGWSNHGSRDSEMPPSDEPKSMVLRMPKNRDAEGRVTLRVRNGDNHEFTALPEVLQTIQPGMTGTATIHNRKLLSFKPDRTQVNLKSKGTVPSVEADGPNQP